MGTTIQINGIETQVPEGAVAFKYADPTEGARWITDRNEASEIASEDPSLVVWAGNTEIEVGSIVTFDSDGALLSGTVLEIAGDAAKVAFGGSKEWIPVADLTEGDCSEC